MAADTEWGSVLIDGYWRAAPVGGVQWSQAEWRVRVGNGPEGAGAAVKRAHSSNVFRQKHPTKRERRYTAGNNPPGSARFNVTPRAEPSVVQITTEGVEMLDVKPQTAPKTENTRRTRPDWDSLGGAVNVRISLNHYRLAEVLTTLDDRPTLGLAISRLIYNGFLTLPPAVQDQIRREAR